MIASDQFQTSKQENKKKRHITVFDRKIRNESFYDTIYNNKMIVMHIYLEYKPMIDHKD